MDIYSELERLKKLLDDGVIAREEFEREKARLLSMNYSVQPVGWDLGIASIVLIIIAIIKAVNGETRAYPFSIRFIK